MLSRFAIFCFSVQVRIGTLLFTFTNADFRVVFIPVPCNVLPYVAIVNPNNADIRA